MVRHTFFRQMGRRLVTLTFVLIIPVHISAQPSVTIADGWFWIDGQKFFVKGIGYEPHTRPGEVPWEYTFDELLVRLDLARIRNAGFNTLRTWDALSPEELKLVEEFGLKVLMGIWIDPHGDYGDPAFVEQAVQRVREVVAYSAKSPALLGYLIMNEPTVADLVAGGPGNLRSLWQRLVAEIRGLAPGVPVSVSLAAVGDFIDPELFDFVGFNLYIYNPLLLRDVTGYAGFVEWLKRRLAPDKPLIITEFGLSVSPSGYGGPFGYGGNTPEQQAAGIIRMYRGLINGGAQGGCVFQYHDGWWKAGNPTVHDDSPEEWFGLFAFTDADDRIGSPRPAWEALASFQQAIVLSPVDGGIYPPELPVEILVSRPVAAVKIVWNHELLAHRSVNPGTWLRETVQLPVTDSLTAGELRLAFYDGNGSLLKSESLICLIHTGAVAFPTLELSLYPQHPQPGSLIRPVFTVARGAGPVALGDTLYYGFFPHVGFDPGESRMTAMAFLNNSWSFTDAFQLPAASKLFSVGGAVELRYQNWRRRLYRIELARINDWAQELALAEPQTTGVFEAAETVPPAVALSSFPNPFSEKTRITLDLFREGEVTLTIYDLLGRVAFERHWSHLNQGRHQVEWTAPIPASGIFFAVVKTGAEVYSTKLILVR